MNDQTPLVTGTDFVFVPVTNVEQTKECYSGVMGETLDSGVCHQAFFADPDGNLLILHNRYAPPATG